MKRRGNSYTCITRDGAWISIRASLAEDRRARQARIEQRISPATET
jgi:hypothetical protein